MINRSHLDLLFDELWPEMPFFAENKANCIDKFEAIEKCFRKFKDIDDNALLESLCALDGIGVTIASGLIWTVDQEARVPLDRFTYTYALFNEWIPGLKLKGNYVKFSEKICAACKAKNMSIEAFVREAREKLKQKSIPEVSMMEPAL